MKKTSGEAFEVALGRNHGLFRALPLPGIGQSIFPNGPRQVLSKVLALPITVVDFHGVAPCRAKPVLQHRADEKWNPGMQIRKIGRETLQQKLSHICAIKLDGTI